MFEIYQSIEGRKKTYLVSTWARGFCLSREYFINEAKRYFHVSRERIICLRAWIVNDELLYLEDPHLRNERMCWVAYLR
jgi:hypothetical protein